MYDDYTAKMNTRQEPYIGLILVFLESWSVSNRERRKLAQGLIVR